MAYTYTSSWGEGIILAPCLQALCKEIAQRYPAAVNVGEIGDASHTTEGYGSDHNPFITHNGRRYVRAIDIGGPVAIQQALFEFIQARYEAHDSRVWPYGYVHMNNQITTWFGTGTHYDAGDVGHLHISVTQANGNHPSPSGWVSALDRTDGWGLQAPPSTKDWFDMASLADLQKAVASAPVSNDTTHNVTSLGDRIVDIETKVNTLVDSMTKVLAKLDAS